MPPLDVAPTNDESIGLNMNDAGSVDPFASRMQEEASSPSDATSDSDGKPVSDLLPPLSPKSPTTGDIRQSVPPSPVDRFANIPTLETPAIFEVGNLLDFHLPFWKAPFLGMADFLPGDHFGGRPPLLSG